MRIKKEIILIFLFFIISSPCYGKEVPFTLEDRDRIIRIEVKISEIDKRFEQIDKRFEQVDKRFEQVGKQIDQLFNFLWILAVIFSSITAATIGFAIWDRRSMIRPFEIKTREIEERIRDLDERKIRNLVESLREIAKADSKVADALRKFNLL